MNAKSVELVEGILALIAAGLFSWIYVVEIWRAFTAQPTIRADTDNPRAYMASLLTGLMTTVVAKGLGLPPKDHNFLKAMILSIGSNAPQFPTWQNITLGVFLGCYLILGTACCITWVAKNPPSALIKNLALVFAGFIVIAVGHLTQTQTQPQTQPQPRP